MSPSPVGPPPSVRRSRLQPKDPCGHKRDRFKFRTLPEFLRGPIQSLVEGQAQKDAANIADIVYGSSVEMSSAQLVQKSTPLRSMRSTPLEELMTQL
jgi:hypothetical protein